MVGQEFLKINATPEQLSLIPMSKGKWWISTPAPSPHRRGNSDSLAPRAIPQDWVPLTPWVTDLITTLLSVLPYAPPGVCLASQQRICIQSSSQSWIWGELKLKHQDNRKHPSLSRSLRALCSALWVHWGVRIGLFGKGLAAAAEPWAAREPRSHRETCPETIVTVQRRKMMTETKAKETDGDEKKLKDRFHQ